MFQYFRLDFVKIVKNSKDIRDVFISKKKLVVFVGKVEFLVLNLQVQFLWFVYFYSKLLFFYKQVNVISLRVLDYCSKYVLNDFIDLSFRGSCDYIYDFFCERCEELKIVLFDIQAVILNSRFESENEKDDVFYVF